MSDTLFGTIVGGCFVLIAWLSGRNGHLAELMRSANQKIYDLRDNDRKLERGKSLVAQLFAFKSRYRGSNNALLAAIAAEALFIAMIALQAFKYQFAELMLGIIGGCLVLYSFLLTLIEIKDAPTTLFRDVDDAIVYYNNLSGVEQIKEPSPEPTFKRFRRLLTNTPAILFPSRSKNTNITQPSIRKTGR